MKRPLVVFLLIVAVCSGCGSDSPTAPDDRLATLSGRVTMASTGGAYYPATVALVDSTQTLRFEPVDTDGRYSFRPFRAGSYVVVLTVGQGAGAREALREPIELTPGSHVKDFVAR